MRQKIILLSLYRSKVLSSLARFKSIELVIPRRRRKNHYKLHCTVDKSCPIRFSCSASALQGKLSCWKSCVRSISFPPACLLSMNPSLRTSENPDSLLPHCVLTQPASKALKASQGDAERRSTCATRTYNFPSNPRAQPSLLQSHVSQRTSLYPGSAPFQHPQ